MLHIKKSDEEDRIDTTDAGLVQVKFLDAVKRWVDDANVKVSEAMNTANKAISDGAEAATITVETNFPKDNFWVHHEMPCESWAR